MGDINPPSRYLKIHRYAECGQPLPESYEPPANEEWTTGIYGYLEDTESCRTDLFCPCLLFGQNVETLRDDVTRSDACFCHTLCLCGIYNGLFRQSLQRKYYLKNSHVIPAWFIAVWIGVHCVKSIER
ncbi:hypothetical protein REPUB_Repub17cG0179800 [Reevesia pubescens]